MESYNDNFTLYFKTRQKSVLAKGENYNYITDYPQDLYIYNHRTKIDKPLISYEWFPSRAKKILPGIVKGEKSIKTGCYVDNILEDSLNIIFLIINT